MFAAFVVLSLVVVGGFLFLHFSHNAKVHALDVKVETAVKNIAAETEAKVKALVTDIEARFEKKSVTRIG